MSNRMTPEQVATLDAYEWVSRARRGESVPTVEQWEAAERLAALARNDAHPDSIDAKLANVISPPEPPPLPEIAACPYCWASCDLVGGAVQCRARCNYVGPARDNARDSIQAHNEVARKLRPTEKTEPEPPKRCSTCRNYTPRGFLPQACHDCDATHAESGEAHFTNWEPKP